jgi:cytochrome P450/nitrite reductase/ring-hydroxylating ferredoxin subunit
MNRTETASPTPREDGPRWTRAARTEELVGDGPFALAADGVDLVAVRTGVSLKVFEGRCPHQGALLGEGEMEGGALVCRNHRWRFDTTTGKRDRGTECLRSCKSELRADGLWVDARTLPREKASTPARRKLADLPHPPRGLPFVGHALHLDVKRLHLVLEKWARDLGDVYAFDVPHKSFLALGDPALIDAALRARPETFRRDERVEPVFEELSVGGVFSAEGVAWRPQRRLAMEALSQKNLRTFYPTLGAVAERLRRRWERAAESGAVVDIQDDLMRFTVDVTTSLVFGRDLNTLDGGEDVIQRHLELVFPTFAKRLNALIPLWRFVRLPADRRVDEAIAAIRAWLAELLTEARARRAAEPDSPPANFLESMLAARDDEGKPFSDEVLFGNAMTMLLAGEDTTANSVAWAVHLLCDAPSEVAELQDELDAALGEAPVPPDLERANRLDRASAVAQEAMRLLPVAPLNFLNANHDTMLGDIEIPKGTGVITLMRVPATNATYFERPLSFQPGRWVDATRGAGAHDPTVLQPFGSGPRICPGRTLALVEMRVMLATLYKNFDVERVGARQAVKELYSFTVGPQDLRVRLKRRAAR